VHAPARERNRLILAGLKLVDLEGIYVPPKVRELLREVQEKGDADRWAEVGGREPA